ncbi:MAG: hypothetical protein F4020_07545, partial [Gammaproteobacteria bacterium]|nr:hypothetical protein [Gammaproteobacteria bacterium]
MDGGNRLGQRRDVPGGQVHQNQPVGALSLLHRHDVFAVRMRVRKGEPAAAGDAGDAAVRIGPVEIVVEAVAVRQLELGEDHAAAGRPREAGQAVGAGEPALRATIQVEQAQMRIGAPVREREGEAPAVRGHLRVQRLARPAGERFAGGERLQCGEGAGEAAVPEGERRAPLVPRLRERDAEGRTRRGVDPIGNQLARHLLHELPHARGVRAFHQVVEELGAVDVGAKSGRPHGAPAGDQGQRLEGVLENAGAQHHVLPGAVDTAGVRQRRLVVGGDPFGQPGGRGASGKEGPGGGVAAQHRAQDAAHATRGIQVKDVHQLVRDHQLDPLVEIVEGPRVRGRA